MRLIDADELINQGYEMVVDGLQYDTCNKSIDIDNIPTAYDINKVVEELNKAKHEIASEDYCRSINDKEKCDGKSCFECCAEYLIEIVKQGGVDDDVCEWKYIDTVSFNAKFSCNGKTRNIKSMRSYKHCPYCGKKIKVVN